jgi:hypothetical protein
MAGEQPRTGARSLAGCCCHAGRDAAARSRVRSWPAGACTGEGRDQDPAEKGRQRDNLGGWRDQGQDQVPADGTGEGGSRADGGSSAQGSGAGDGSGAGKQAAPWFERARRSHSAPGQRHCGLLERILHRQWQADELPPAQIVLAVDRLAEFPQLIKERLVAGLDAIYLGPGGVPDLDDMSSLSGMPLPSGRATWDACAGAYGDRKVIVGSRPSPTPDVLCHEIGHALDDIDGMESAWQSDSHEFSTLYGQCRPWMTTDFHRQSGPMGRREFFADAFAAIASSQRPALVEMLGGNTRVALGVMLCFNVRYGI